MSAPDTSENAESAPTRRALAGYAGWTALARIVAQAAQFLGFVVAARILGPADFGLFSLVLVSSTLLMILASAGWYERLLSAENERPYLHAIALSGGVVAALLVLIGGLIASNLIGESDIARLSFFFALSMPFLTCGRLQAAVLVADKRIGRSAFVQISSELMALAALVFSLIEGLGLLALGVSKLVLATVAWSVAVYSTRWHRMSLPSFAHFITIFQFTRNILASQLTFFIQENASVMLVGAFLGPSGAGLYRAGARVAGAIGEVFTETTKMVAWTSFRAARRSASESDAVADAALRLSAATFLFALPMFLGVSLVAYDLARVLLGPEWISSATVIILLALRRLMQVIQPIADPLFILVGEVSLIPKLALLSVGATLVALVVAAPFGIAWAAAGQVAAAATVAPLRFWLFSRHSGLHPGRLAKAVAPAAIASAAMAFAIFALQGLLVEYGLSPLQRLLGEIAVGVLIYAIVVSLIDPMVTNSVRRFMNRLPAPLDSNANEDK